MLSEPDSHFPRLIFIQKNYYLFYELRVILSTIVLCTSVFSMIFSFSNSDGNFSTDSSFSFSFGFFAVAYYPRILPRTYYFKMTINKKLLVYDFLVVVLVVCSGSILIFDY